MNHYVKQTVTKGINCKTIDNYSAYNIKDVVLHIMQTNFTKKLQDIRYNITKPLSNLLDEELFYTTGLKYKDIKKLDNEDIEDICLMINNSGRTSLNYIRICKYMTVSPILSKNIINNESLYNKELKPLKISLIPSHILNYYYNIRKYVSDTKYVLTPGLEKELGLDPKIVYIKCDIEDIVRKIMLSSGINLCNINYSLLPVNLINVMNKDCVHFSSDFRSNYYKGFGSFFNDYFKNKRGYYPNVSLDYSNNVKITPYLAYILNLDMNNLYNLSVLRQKLLNVTYDIKKTIMYTTKDCYIKKRKISDDTILKYHTCVDYKFISVKNPKVNEKYSPENVYKAGKIIHAFYKKHVKK